MHHPHRAATMVTGVMVAEAIFQPSTSTTGVPVSLSGSSAVSIVDSPGISSIQLSDQ